MASSSVEDSLAHVIIVEQAGHHPVPVWVPAPSKGAQSLTGVGSSDAFTWTSGTTPSAFLDRIRMNG